MKRYLRGVVLILSIGILISTGVHLKHRNDLETARRNFVQEERYKTRQVATRVEEVFHTMYEGMRIITRLPGVKNIDRYAQNLDVNTRRAVHEIYNNIADNVALSEIYIVPLDFDPERIDPVLGQPEEPVIMFDNRITGRTVLSQTAGVAEHPEVPEIEIEEYRQMVGQLQWMKTHAPREAKPMDLAVPALSSPEVVTCDNTRYNPLAPDDRDRSGIVYSLPLYAYSGELKGMVSGIILTDVLKTFLPSADYILINRRNGYRAGRDNGQVPHIKNASSWISRLQPDPGLIYSEVFPLRILDQDSDWYLWGGIPNESFSQRQDVQMAGQFAALGFLGVFILTAFSLFGYFLSCRHRDHLERMNRELVKHQSLLESSQKRLKRFSGALMSVREEEKKRLSRDLHDTVGSMAVGLNARMKVLEDSIAQDKKDRALDHTAGMKDSIRTFVTYFKHIALSLRPPQLEEVGFVGALSEYCEEIAEVQPLAITLDVNIDDCELSDELSIALYRVVQECLNNIIKHAKADRVVIRVFPKGGDLCLMIIDNGIGFDPESVPSGQSGGGLGLIGIRERVESFGGMVEFDSQPGNGTRVRIAVPLHRTKSS